MRLYCAVITCLVLFVSCSLAQFSQGPDKCCFSYSTLKIPVRQVESYQITHLECHRRGIIFTTKAQKDICTDPAENWVQRLKKLVDARVKEPVTEGSFDDSA